MKSCVVYYNHKEIPNEVDRFTQIGMVIGRPVGVVPDDRQDGQ